MYCLFLIEKASRFFSFHFTTVLQQLAFFAAILQLVGSILDTQIFRKS